MPSLKPLRDIIRGYHIMYCKLLKGVIQRLLQSRRGLFDESLNFSRLEFDVVDPEVVDEAVPAFGVLLVLGPSTDHHVFKFDFDRLRDQHRVAVERRDVQLAVHVEFDVIPRRPGHDEVLPLRGLDVGGTLVVKPVLIVDLEWKPALDDVAA